VLNGGGWVLPCPGNFTPMKETTYPFYRGWMGLRAIQDGCQKYAQNRMRSHASAACSKLYKLCNPSPQFAVYSLSIGLLCKYYNLNSVMSYT
jgi:hypothetical protein